MRKTVTGAILALVVACGATPWTDYVQLTVREGIRSPAPHPRLFAGTNDFARLRAETNELVRLCRDRVIYEADQMRRFPLPLRRLEGRRMLTISQRSLARIGTLATAYRLTDDVRYARRAIEEAETVCAFKDWNPAHFLDTAEMTLAVALAYDWLHDAMTPAQRAAVLKGLLRNGLREKSGGPKTGGWVGASNNWGQVCHASLAAGAIAVMDKEPVLAEKILVRAATALPCPMKAYDVSGGFAEGPGFYWGYATTFTALAIDAFTHAFGTDFGLGDLPGFGATVDYLDLTTGPTGLKYAYADAGIASRQDLFARRETEACSWWLARRFDRPDSLVQFEIPRLRAYCADRTPPNPTPRRSPRRLFPFTLLWMAPPPADVHETRAPLCRLLGGEAPVAVQRTSWDPFAWYVGIKGGSPSSPHGHMDVGSFVLDAKGCRWATDLGSEDYHRMEALGRDLWNMTQNSDRWRVFRLGAAGHSVLRINGGDQYVGGRASFTSFTNDPISKVVLDLTPLYPGVTNVVRTGTLIPGGGYILDDRLEGLPKGAVVQWQMPTPARVKSVEDNVLTLAQTDPEGDEATLALTVSDRHAHWEVNDVSAAQGLDESANPGHAIVSFSLLAPESGVVDFSVKFE